MLEDVFPNVSTPETNESRVVRQWQVSELQGTLLTHIESLGLQERQEKAIKSMVKRDLWDWYYRAIRLKETEGGKLEYINELDMIGQVDRKPPKNKK